MESVTFNKGDLLFDPVAAFFASWAGYHAMHASCPYDVVSGRLRGFVVPQLCFEDDPIIGILRRREDILRVHFEIVEEEAGDPLGQQIKSGHLMWFWCQQMFGHGFETARSHIEAKFGSDRKTTWPPELQVAYHIRNGCFHGNTFDIRPNAISTVVPTVWRSRPITYADNGTTLAGGFFGPADFITLLADVQNCLHASKERLPTG